MNKEILTFSKITIKQALALLNKTGLKTLLIVDEKNRLLGTLTDGDIRRFILKNTDINSTIEQIYNRNPIKIYKEDITNKDKLKNIFLKNKIEVLPVVDIDNTFINYLTWSDFFLEKEFKYKVLNKINIPVVIMAGGKGTRLQPFTYVLPKPLIPVDNKTIIEHIIDSFKIYAVKTFYIIVNYKSEMIKAYFKGLNTNYNIEFIEEKDYLGTAGGLIYLKDRIKGDFFVSNCDVLLNIDFYKLYKFHLQKQSCFTSITALVNYKIPYGIIDIDKGGKILSVKEKPDFIFQINTGVYLLNSKVFDYIPHSKKFDMPDLLKIVMQEKKAFAYPISESRYLDIGQWHEYRKTIDKLNTFLR